MNRRRHQPMLAAMNFPMSFAKLRANVRVPPHQTSGRSRPLLPPCTLARLGLFAQHYSPAAQSLPRLQRRRSIYPSSLSYTPHPASCSSCGYCYCYCCYSPWVCYGQVRGRGGAAIGVTKSLSRSSVCLTLTSQWQATPRGQTRFMRVA